MLWKTASKRRFRTLCEACWMIVIIHSVNAARATKEVLLTCNYRGKFIRHSGKFLKGL